MPNTRGNLVPAAIYELDENGIPKPDGVRIACMFNPYQYTISKTNSYTESPAPNSNSPLPDFLQAGAISLELSLIFDTSEMSEISPLGVPVNRYTDKLFKMMEVHEKPAGPSEAKLEPHHVAFHWGMFYFVAVLVSVTQEFTLFKPDGTPLRAKVNVTFKSFRDPKKFPFQNPTSGDGPIQKTWRVTAGDRLDTIAFEVYRDAGQWRRIAAFNRINDPLSLRPGQLLAIPME